MQGSFCILRTLLGNHIVANENQQNDATAQSDGADAARVLGARGVSRRRFARAGAGATGVLLTLASQPGMACSVCTTPSGFQSYRKSKTESSHKTTVVCVGRGPDYWNDYGRAWPSGCSKASLFRTVFSCNSGTKYTYGAITCYDMIKQQQSCDSYKVAMYLVAAWLNVKAGKSSFLTVPMLQSIWNEYQTKNSYTPYAGSEVWGPTDIILYLSGTMD